MKNRLALPAILIRPVTQSTVRLVTSAAGGLFLLLLALLAFLIRPVPDLNADGPDDGYVVVQFGNGGTIGRSISFTTAITGAQALIEAGLDVVTAGSGASIQICSIEGVGCPANDCFCSCPPPYEPCLFWGQYYQDSGDSDWNFGSGAGVDTVGNGGAHGFSWGGQNLPPLPAVTSALKALNWLHDQQENDGGYGSQGNTAESHLAVAANRLPAAGWISAGNSLVDYWSLASNSANNAADFAAGNAGKAGKLAVAVAGARGNPQDFTASGLNLGLSLTNYYSPTTGAFDPNNNINQMWAILGWRAIYTDTQPLTSTATQFLLTQSNGDGTWSWAPGLPHDSNTTALAVQALIAGGECLTSPHVTRAVNYLRSIQNSDGGFPADDGWPGSDQSDANSTAWVIQALRAANEDPFGSEWTVNGQTPLNYLLGRQLADGSLAWQDPAAGSNMFATQQAVAGLLGRSFPFETQRPTQCAVTAVDYWLPLIVKNDG